MNEGKIAELVRSLLSGISGISKTETVVGAPQKAGDTTVIPVHRLKIAFGAASGRADAQGTKVGGRSGGQGAGGAVEIEPIAAITVGKDGTTRFFTVQGDEPAAWTRLLQQLPELLARVAQTVGERVRTEIGASPVPDEPDPSETESGAALEPRAALNRNSRAP